MLELIKNEQYRFITVFLLTPIEVRAINDRNQLSHIYRQKMAETIRQRLPEYVQMVEHIVGVMQEKQ